MDQFLTEETFFTKIDSIVKETGLNYIEAVVHFCEENDLEMEEITKLIGRSLKDRLKVDAMNNGYLKKESCLPI